VKFKPIDKAHAMLLLGKLSGIIQSNKTSIYTKLIKKAMKQASENPMNQNDTTQSLIHAFQFDKPAEMLAKQKPGSSPVSKPNHAKVGPVSNGLVHAVMQTNAGWGTMYAVGLEMVRKSALLILAHVDEEKFDATKGIVLTQLQILQDHIKAWSVQGTKADYKAWTESMSKPSPKGAIGKESPAEAAAAIDKPIVVSGNETEEELKAKLEAAMAELDNIKKDPSSVN